MRSFGLFFASVPDPRAANARHDLAELLFISFAAVLCGAENCQDMADFGADRAASLRKVLRLRGGIPSHDTFSRVFRLLDPVAFEAAFRRFMAAFAAHLSGQVGLAGQTIAIDGKSLSGAFAAGARSSPLHLVTAWATEHRLVLGQCVAPGRNEVEGALNLVALLDLEAATVTADALHGNRKMAEAIRARGGDYVLAVKGNRGPLYGAAKVLLAEAPVGARQVEPKPGHARHEERQVCVVPVPPDWADQYKFKDLAAVARIDAIRRIGSTETSQSRFFLLSRVLDPEQVLRTVRAHWGIENRQHWVLDVVFDEDHARARKDNAGQNLAILRRLVLSLLQHDARKMAIRRKIKRAGWSEAQLFTLLSQMR